MNPFPLAQLVPSPTKAILTLASLSSSREWLLLLCFGMDLRGKQRGGMDSETGLWEKGKKGLCFSLSSPPAEGLNGASDAPQEGVTAVHIQCISLPGNDCVLKALWQHWGGRQCGDRMLAQQSPHDHVVPGCQPANEEALPTEEEHSGGGEAAMADPPGEKGGDEVEEGEAALKGRRCRVDHKSCTGSLDGILGDGGGIQEGVPVLRGHLRPVSVGSLKVQRDFSGWGEGRGRRARGDEWRMASAPGRRAQPGRCSQRAHMPRQPWPCGPGRALSP